MSCCSFVGLPIEYSVCAIAEENEMTSEKLRTKSRRWAVGDMLAALTIPVPAPRLNWTLVLVWRDDQSLPAVVGGRFDRLVSIVSSDLGSMPSKLCKAWHRGVLLTQLNVTHERKSSSPLACIHRMGRSRLFI